VPKLPRSSSARPVAALSTACSSALTAGSDAIRSATLGKAGSAAEGSPAGTAPGPGIGVPDTGTSRPCLPSARISRGPLGQSVETTGVPNARASMSANPSPSQRDVKANRSACARYA